MNNRLILRVCLILTLCTLCSSMFSHTALNDLFADSGLPLAPLSDWAAAGSNAVIDSVFTIDVTAIPDSITYVSNGVSVPIPDAQSGDGYDNSDVFKRLIKWINSNVDSVNVHT